jgi:hypothetical protein
MNNHSIWDILSVYWIIVTVDIGVLWLFIRATKKSSAKK